MADDTTPDDVTPPTPQPRRRRATAPAGVPTAVADPDAPPAAVGPGPAAADVPATADADPVEVVRRAMAELAGGVADRPGAAPARAAGGDDPGGTIPRDGEPGDLPGGGDDAAVHPMNVLFQAPSADAATSRRRRAVASAGPAQPALFAPPAAGEDRDAMIGESSVARVIGTEDDEHADHADDVDPDALEDDADADDSDDDSEDDSEDEDDADGADETDEASSGSRRRRRRGGRGRRRRRTEPGGDADVSGDTDGSTDRSEPSGRAEGAGGSPRASGAAADSDDGDGDGDEEDADAADDGALSRSARRRRRRRRRSGDETGEPASEGGGDVASVRGSTRLEAKRQRRREGRDSTRRRTVITEAEFLARRESVDRTLLVRERDGRTQIAVLEDGVLVEHYVTQASQQSMIGNVHLGKVQNVLPSMEAAFVDIGRGRNAVLYAGEVNWDAANLTSKADRRIEAALKPGDPVLVQVTKDPVAHKGARLTSQVSLPGRFVVLVPGGSMTGISRKLPDTERNRLKRILQRVLPEDAGVIVRTAAEGAAEEDIERDVARLAAQWQDIRRKSASVSAPALLYSEPDLAIRVVRDVFNEDISRLVVSGDDTWDTLQAYVSHVAPDLVPRLSRWEPRPDGPDDVFAAHRVDEQIAKGLERKVWLPSGGSLVIDRTEAMTVVDVNTGKFTGSGGDLEETVTRNNLEAAEEIVRQLRLRDIGGIIVVDFIDMVLEGNRQLVLRRLVECLGRDRTKHQVAEVTSLGLVQMTRKRVGQGLLEAFSTPCETCHGRGVLVHDHPVDPGGRGESGGGGEGRDRSRRGRRVDQPA